MRAIIPLAAGLVIGLLAIYYVTDYVKKQRGPSASVPTVQVVRARADIGPTVEITEGMVKLVDVPKTLAPKNGFSDLKEVVGRVTSQTIPEGTPVVQSYLAPPGTPPGMAVRIRDGFRAVAVTVDESVGVAGWIKPDSRVDVVILLDIKGQGATRGQTYSRTLLQDVRVLAVGQDLGMQGEPGAKLSRSVTLEVTPKQAQLLHMSATQGRLRLAMRNPHDAEQERLEANTADDLLREETPSTRPSGGVLGKLASAFKRPNEEKTEVAPASPEPVVVAAPSPEPKNAVRKEHWVVEVLSGARQAELIRLERSGPAAPWTRVEPTTANRRLTPPATQPARQVARGGQAAPAARAVAPSTLPPPAPEGTEENEEETVDAEPVAAG